MNGFSEAISYYFQLFPLHSIYNEINSLLFQLFALAVLTWKMAKVLAHPWKEDRPVPVWSYRTFHNDGSRFCIAPILILKCRRNQCRVTRVLLVKGKSLRDYIIRMQKKKQKKNDWTIERYEQHKFSTVPHSFHILTSKHCWISPNYFKILLQHLNV